MIWFKRQVRRSTTNKDTKGTAFIMATPMRALARSNLKVNNIGYLQRKEVSAHY